MTSLQAGREMAENIQKFVLKKKKIHREDEEELQEEGASEDQINLKQRDTASCKS